ncbi:hypothetical protein [Methylobacterium isbiliense]|uniref:Uncharacterized protein n=1 Tax=Methylobacterium isbiliense TaxID=315478 RepID=A0ABQ4S9Y2_9HYPH|nr:hypothetical protein [Methylobacterium isbiliense]MDN3626618.1 hypothetical protein [Methylobacterium isbiliense]GJD99280.1 hypothetical protein GMJLKIPL_1196 [Methylobacterium isbiliense]
MSFEWWVHVLERKDVRQGSAVTLSAQEREMLTMMIEDLERRTADMVTLMSGPQLAPVD